MIEVIKREIGNNIRFAQMLTSVSSITIIEYDAVNVVGTRAILKFLTEYADWGQIDVTVILLGDNTGRILHNEEALKSEWNKINVLRTGNIWDKQNFEALNISSILILHILFSIGIDNSSVSIFNLKKYRQQKLINSIINSTRQAYYATFLNSNTNSLFDRPIVIDFKDNLKDLRFTSLRDDKQKPTLFCSDKKEYMEHAVENLDAKDSFFLCFDEMESGCTACNQCGKYMMQRHCPMAQCKIAEFYRTGYFVDHDDKIGHQWYLKAARQNYPPALIAVADNLAEGIGCEQDISRAIRIYTSLASCSTYKHLASLIINLVENNAELSPVIAIKFMAMLANDGNTDYIRRLITAFEVGNYGLPVDEEQKSYWESWLSRHIRTSVNERKSNRIPDLIHQAEIGSIKAQIELCDLYFSGTAVPEDYEQSAYWGEKAIAQGDKSCRFKVAYSSSKSGNRSRALALYSELAEEGDQVAMNNLGCLEENTDKKIFWFKKAAESGSCTAQYNIGIYYKGGIGVEQSYQEALRYMEMAAKSGYEPAMIEIARLYKNGYGIEQDTAKMLQWYEKAITNGNVTAMLEVASLYRYGNYVDEDCAKAMDYYRRAVQTGESGSFTEKSPQLDAMYNIGKMWELGETGIRNIDKAIFWFRKAALHNHADSKKALIRLGTNWIDKNGNTVSK